MYRCLFSTAKNDTFYNTGLVALEEVSQNVMQNVEGKTQNEAIPAIW